MAYHHSHFVFEGVKDNTLIMINGDYLCSWRGFIYVSIEEAKDKAKELFDKFNKTNEIDGVLIRIFRNNAWNETVKYYELYYNGKKFIKNPDFLYYEFEGKKYYWDMTLPYKNQ